jgi:hypothetical protein
MFTLGTIAVILILSVIAVAILLVTQGHPEHKESLNPYDKLQARIYDSFVQTSQHLASTLKPDFSPGSIVWVDPDVKGNGWHKIQGELTSPEQGKVISVKVDDSYLYDKLANKLEAWFLAAYQTELAKRELNTTDWAKLLIEFLKTSPVEPPYCTFVYTVELNNKHTVTAPATYLRQ